MQLLPACLKLNIGLQADLPLSSFQCVIYPIIDDSWDTQKKNSYYQCWTLPVRPPTTTRLLFIITEEPVAKAALLSSEIIFVCWDYWKSENKEISRTKMFFIWKFCKLSRCSVELLTFLVVGMEPSAEGPQPGQNIYLRLCSDDRNLHRQRWWCRCCQQPLLSIRILSRSSEDRLEGRYCTE